MRQPRAARRVDPAAGRRVRNRRGGGRASTSPVRRCRASGSSATPRRRSAPASSCAIRDLALVDVEITGAQRRRRSSTRAGPAARWWPATSTTIRAPAIVVRAGASPRIAHNVFARNATSERARRPAARRGRRAVPSCRANTFQRRHGRTSIVGLPRERRRVPVAARQLVHAGRIRSSARRGFARQRAAMTTVFQRVGPYEIVRRDRTRRDGDRSSWPRIRATRRRVALKLVSDDADDRRGAGDSRRGALGRAAAGAARRRRAALVPRVYEDGELPPYYFIAMEYVDGREPLRRHRARPGRAGRGAPHRRASCAGSSTAAHRFETTHRRACLSSRSCTAI